MFKQIGPLEIVLIFILVMVLFGAKRLPDAARGLGRSLRIFKAETKGLNDSEDASPATPGAVTAATVPTAAVSPTDPMGAGQAAPDTTPRPQA